MEIAGIWFLAKLAVLFALGIYIVFSFVVVKQVKLMCNTLSLGFEGVLRTVAFIHLVLAVLVFFFALTFL